MGEITHAQIGRAFVKQYYTLLYESTSNISRLYNDTSTLVHGGKDSTGEADVCYGLEQISEKFKRLNLAGCHTRIIQLDSARTLGGGVVLQVSGELTTHEGMVRKFMQTFVLGQLETRKFFVVNDIFRYQDDVFGFDESTQYFDNSFFQQSSNVGPVTGAVLSSPSEMASLGESQQHVRSSSGNDSECRSQQYYDTMKGHQQFGHQHQRTAGFSGYGGSPSLQQSPDAISPLASSAFIDQRSLNEQPKAATRKQNTCTPSPSAGAKYSQYNPNLGSVAQHQNSAPANGSARLCAVADSQQQQHYADGTDQMSSYPSVDSQHHQLPQRKHDSTKVRSNQSGMHPTDHQSKGQRPCNARRESTTAQATNSTETCDQTTMMTTQATKTAQAAPKSSASSWAAIASRGSDRNMNKNDSRDLHFPAGLSSSSLHHQQANKVTAPAKPPASGWTTVPSSSTSANENQRQQSQPQQQGFKNSRPATGYHANQPKQAYQSANRYPEDQQVFVGNISNNVDEDTLCQLLSNYGAVLDVHLTTRNINDRPNFAFVVFDSSETVEKLVTEANASPVRLHGKRLNIERRNFSTGNNNNNNGNTGLPGGTRGNVSNTAGSTVPSYARAIGAAGANQPRRAQAVGGGGSYGKVNSGSFHRN